MNSSEDEIEGKVEYTPAHEIQRKTWYVIVADVFSGMFTLIPSHTAFGTTAYTALIVIYIWLSTAGANLCEELLHETFERDTGKMKISTHFTLAANLTWQIILWIFIFCSVKDFERDNSAALVYFCILFTIMWNAMTLYDLKILMPAQYLHECPTCNVVCKTELLPDSLSNAKCRRCESDLFVNQNDILKQFTSLFSKRYPYDVVHICPTEYCNYYLCLNCAVKLKNFKVCGCEELWTCKKQST